MFACEHVGCQFKADSRARVNSHQRAYNSHTTHFEVHKQSCPACLRMLECGEWTDLSVYAAFDVVTTPIATPSALPPLVAPAPPAAAPVAAHPRPTSARAAAAALRRQIDEAHMRARTSAPPHSPPAHARSPPALSPTLPPPPRSGSGSRSRSGSGSGSGEASESSGSGSPGSSEREGGESSIDFFQCAHEGCNWRSRAQGDNDKRASVAKHEKSVVKHRKHHAQHGDTCLCCSTLVDTGVWRVDNGILVDITLRKHRDADADADDAVPADAPAPADAASTKRRKLLSGAAHASQDHAPAALLLARPDPRPAPPPALGKRPRPSPIPPYDSPSPTPRGDAARLAVRSW